MKKWMIFMRESDGVHFLWNGEGCVRVSTLNSSPGFSAPRWHHKYDEIPDDEIIELNRVMNKPGKRVFELKGYGRYQIISRGEFKEL